MSKANRLILIAGSVSFAVILAATIIFAVASHGRNADSDQASAGISSPPVTTLAPSAVATAEPTPKAINLDFMAGVKRNDSIANVQLSDAFIRSTAAFSADLFKNSVVKGKNSLVSPVSVYMALGMTANGAANETKTAFENVLGRYGLTVGDLNQHYRSYINSFIGLNGDSVCTLANSVWFNEDFEPRQEFLQANADNFGAGVQKLDFSNPASVTIINDWVSKNTRGLIKDAIDSLSPVTVMNIINATYFEAYWVGYMNLTAEMDFYKAGSETLKVKYLAEENNLNYIDTDNVNGVILPYKDGRFCFLAIMPKGETTVYEYARSFNEYTVGALTGSASMQLVEVLLPQFTTRSEFRLNSALSGMGLSQAFDPGIADFGNIGRSGMNIYINSVVHKTYMQINQKGTVAGAFTNIDMMGNVPMEPIKITFNKPFVYAVVDLTTNLPLFIGTMEDPAAAN